MVLTQRAEHHSNRARFPIGENRVTEPDTQQRMAQLEAKIDAAKQAQAPAPKKEEHYSQAQQAWRMVIELVAGLGIGFGIGYGLDTVFGTLPVFMLIFTCLGLVAGVKTMIRTAHELQGDQMALEAERDAAGQARDDTDAADKTATMREPENGK